MEHSSLFQRLGIALLASYLGAALPALVVMAFQRVFGALMPYSNVSILREDLTQACLWALPFAITGFALVLSSRSRALFWLMAIWHLVAISIVLSLAGLQPADALTSYWLVTVPLILAVGPSALLAKYINRVAIEQSNGRRLAT